MSWRDPRRRPMRLIIVLALLIALTGCWSYRAFTNYICPSCPPYRFSPPVNPD